ncbi:MAG: DUF1127 domain-containing protein [Alphaproteobacteria bacterium]|nr:DUF1127 domain-containing protein [Alphaproteobacteria bacterium]
MSTTQNPSNFPATRISAGHAVLGLLLETFDPRPLLRLLATWRQRARMRRQLAHLDDRLLRDIGVSPIEAGREIIKPFWSE